MAVPDGSVIRFHRNQGELTGRLIVYGGMQARHAAALSAYRSSYRPMYRPANRNEPAPEYRVHPIMWVILASAAFWAVLIASLAALFG